MSKTVKKLLSVVLAVLVLAAGFSTMLGSFVMADPAWTYDYTTLVSEVSTAEGIATTQNPNGEKGLYPRQGIQVKESYAVVPDSFGLYDTNGFGVNVSSTFAGLRVFDDFFSRGNANAVYAVGADTSEIHPYITYEVEPGTEFRIQYYTYTKSQWEAFGHSDKVDDFYFVDILVSSDGVNWVPAKVENEVILYPIKDANFDHVTATVANVGANTRFVKVQSSVDVDTVTYKLNDKEQWVYNYIPQDALFIQKVKLTAPTSVDASVKKVSFANKTTTINGEAYTGADARGLFLSSPKTHAARNGGFHPIGDELYQNAAWQNRYAWNYFSENDRDYYLRVQPGTRFVLGWSNYGSHDDIARALVGAYPEQYKTPEDFAVKVYTTDNLAGEWTEHRMAPSSNHSSYAMYFTFNFIIPENHSYVRIVTPISGSIGSVMKLDENGKPMESAQANAVSNSAGNDWCLIDSMEYTPFSYSYEKTYDYATSGQDSSSYYSNSFGFNSGLGYSQSYSGNYTKVFPYLLDKSEGTDAQIAASERTDDQLMNLVYKVKGDTFFDATIDLKYDSGALWYKTGHDKYKGTDTEEMHFKILTSADGNEWTTQATLGLGDDLYMRDNRSNSLKYNIGVYVPKGHNFVKVISYCRGYIVVGTNAVNFNNCFAVCGVKYSSAVSAQAGEASYPYNDLSIFPYGSSFETVDTLTAGPISAGATFNSTTGAVASSKVNLDNWGGSKLGVTIEYSAHGSNANTATKAGVGERPYVIYQVKPGTEFKADLKVDYNTKVKAEAETTNKDANGNVIKPFEFYFSTSDSINGEYTQVYKTKTISSALQNHSVNIAIPEDASYIKIEWPQTGWSQNAGNTTYAPQNHNAPLYSVTYVPATYAEGAETFNYANATVASVKDNVSQFGAINASSWDLKLISGAVRYENFSTCIEKVGDSYVAKLDKEWGKVERPYIIYEVMPGTTFAADIFFHTNRTKINDTWLPAALEAGLITDESKFEFTFEASATADGGWKNAADTSALASNATSTMTYDVPADCKYVKITFPQRGAVIQNTTSVVTDGNDVLRYAAAAMNDMASIKGVSYIPADADVVIENDYATKSDKVLGNETKAEFEVYNFSEVEATANGVAAIEDAENAFVEYKVSNDEALVIKSDDKLDIEVSYDGENFAKAQVSAYGGAYTINTLDGKQYVRVYLDAGEAISAVSAATLAPTATFVNAAGNKQVIELDSFGATPAPTLNTARAGYTFSGWDNAVEALYLDTTFKAKYDKAEETYAITVENGTIVSVAGKEEGDTEATARFDDRVVIEAPATDEGLVFDKWVVLKDGNPTETVVSNSHKFSFLASGDLALYAQYAEVKGEVNPFIYNAGSAIVTDNGDKWNMSVTWSVNVPAGATIKETGIVLAATETEMTKGAANTATMKHSSVGTGKTLMFTVTGIADGAKRYACPYAVLADDTVIYGTTVTATDAQ